MKVLEIEELSIGIADRDGSRSDIVKEVTFSLEQGEIYGLLGESGTGKTLLAYACCGLLQPPVRISGGTIRLAGETVVPGKKQVWRGRRGKEIFMMFQGASSALNPYLTVGRQLTEALVHVRCLSSKKALQRAGSLLKQVGLKEELVHAYPFQLSGGMQQRVLIAIAIALRPRILIADEPTTGLDAVSERRILDLLRRLREQGMAILFISHDIRAVSTLTEQTGVMFQGRLVESGPTRQVLAEPRHRYTREMIAALKSID